VIINQNSSTASSKISANKTNKVKSENIDLNTKDVVELSKEIDKVQQEITNMTYACNNWHSKKADAESNQGSMKLEIATLLGSIAIGFKAFCLTMGNPLCLVGGIVAGGVIGTVIANKKNKNAKKVQQELASEENTIKSYEKTIQSDQVKLQELKDVKHKKEVEENQKKKEAKEVKQKEAEEAKKKAEEEKMAPLNNQADNFRKNNKILSETKILHGEGWTFSGSEWSYTIGQADIIDINGNGKADTTMDPVGNLRKEYLYDEPALDMPYEQIKAMGTEMKKGIITRDDVKNLGVRDFGVSSGFSAFSKDYEISRNKRFMHNLVKDLEPYSEKARWAIDITKGTFIVYESING
jgi:hypothetical protein